MAKELDEELLEEDEFDTEEDEAEEMEESAETNEELNEFELCIQAYLNDHANNDEFFKVVYRPEDIKNCCQYIINTVKSTKRSAFTDDEVYKMARDYYIDHKEAPKDKERAKKIVVPSSKAVKKEEESGQLSLFDL